MRRCVTKGGRASGPEPLRKMLDFSRARILARQGSFLRPIDAHDIMCAVGDAAVSGGVRRTAMISLFRLRRSGDAPLQGRRLLARQQPALERQQLGRLAGAGADPGRDHPLCAGHGRIRPRRAGHLQPASLRQYAARRGARRPNSAPIPAARSFCAPTSSVISAAPSLAPTTPTRRSRKRWNWRPSSARIQSMATHFPGLRRRMAARTARKSACWAWTSTVSWIALLAQDPDSSAQAAGSARWRPTRNLRRKAGDQPIGFRDLRQAVGQLVPAAEQFVRSSRALGTLLHPQRARWRAFAGFQGACMTPACPWIRRMARRATTPRPGSSISR